MSAVALRRLAPFWLYILVFKIAASLHYSIMPVLGARVFPIAVVGMLIAMEALVQLLLDIPAGFLLDRYGYRRFLVVTTVLFVLAAAVLLFGLSWMTVTVTLALSVFGWLFFNPGINAYILSEIPHSLASRAMALRDTFDAAGTAIGAAVLAVLLGSSLPHVGAVLMVLFVVSMTMLLVVPRDHTSVHAAQKIATHHFHIRRTPLRAMIQALQRLNPASTMLLVSGFAGCTFFGIVWFAIPLAMSGNTMDGIPGMGLGIFDATIVVMGMMIGRLVNRANYRILAFIGLLIFAIAGAALGFSTGWWFLVLGCILTIGYELSNVSLWTWLHRLDHQHTEDAAVASAITACHDLGWAIGPLLAGFLLVPIGIAWTLTMGAGFLFLAWVACILVFGPRDVRALVSPMHASVRPPIRYVHRR